MLNASISDGLGLSVDLLNYGARICGIKYNGVPLALGYNNYEDYLQDSFYMGASIGPITNRVANGQLVINGDVLTMPCNEGGNTLHSGGAGFDKQYWQVESINSDTVCYRLDYDMAQIGLKGLLTTWATYQVNDGCLTIKYQSQCDTTCFINPTNHVYLNLGGVADDSQTDISDHLFTLSATSYVCVDQHNLPTGTVSPIASPFHYTITDPTIPEFSGACDHHFNVGDHEMGSIKSMLSVVSKRSGIALDVLGNSPGFQFYTGKFLESPFAASAGFCVETQLAPDAINQSGFYAPLLEAGEQREQITHLQFRQQSDPSE